MRRGFSVSEYGVTTVETGEVFATEDEEQVYAHLGYQLIPPELRENTESWRPPARAAAARSSSSATSWATCTPLDVVERRQGDARGDGGWRRGRAAIAIWP